MCVLTGEKTAASSDWMLFVGLDIDIRFIYVQSLTNLIGIRWEINLKISTYLWSRAGGMHLSSVCALTSSRT